MGIMEIYCWSKIGILLVLLWAMWRENRRLRGELYTCERRLSLSEEGRNDALKEKQKNSVGLDEALELNLKLEKNLELMKRDLESLNEQNKQVSRDNTELSAKERAYREECLVRGELIDSLRSERDEIQNKFDSLLNRTEDLAKLKDSITQAINVFEAPF